MPEINDTVPHQVNLIPTENTVVTGTIGDGSCFIHSLIFGMSAREYYEKSLESRIEYVRHVRKLLSNTFTFNEWINFNNIEIVINNLIINIVEKLYENETFISSDTFKSDVTFKSYNDVDAANMFTTIFNMREPWSPAEYIRRLSEFFGHHYAKKIVDGAINRSYKRFIRDIANPNEWIGDDIVEKAPGYLTTPSIRPILEKMQIFAIIINDDGDIYQDIKFNREYLLKFKFAVMINYTGNSHYDSMGIVNQQNKIDRLFKLDDERIQPLLDNMIEEA